MKLSKLRAAHNTRTVRGQSVPRQDTTSFGMRAALKKGGSGYAGASGEVEGGASRPRLDRPGRKHGGKVMHRAVGGRSGESDVEVRQAATDRSADLKKKANAEENAGAAKTAAGLVVGGALPGALLASRAGVGKKILGTLGAVAAGTKLADTASPNLAKTKELRDQAREDDWSAAGNERKFGGRAKSKDDDERRSAWEGIRRAYGGKVK